MDTLLNYCRIVSRRLESVPNGKQNAKPWEEFALYVLTHRNAEQFASGDAHYVFLYTEFITDRIWAKPFREFARHYKSWMMR